VNPDKGLTQVEVRRLVGVLHELVQLCGIVVERLSNAFIDKDDPAIDYVGSWHIVAMRCGLAALVQHGYVPVGCDVVHLALLPGRLWAMLLDRIRQGISSGARQGGQDGVLDGWTQWAQAGGSYEPSAAQGKGQRER
jgi:hypothetical protein